MGYVSLKMTCGFIELKSKKNCQNSTHVKIEHHRYLPNLLKQNVKGSGCQSELPTFNYTTAVSPFKHLYFSEIQNYRIKDLFDAEVDFRRKSDILRYEVYL